MARKKPSEPADYPQKLFYKINEVATITGVEPYVLRYWESRIPTLAPEKDEKDQRWYRQKDIELVKVIKRLIYEDKYTVSGAAEVLRRGKAGKIAPPAERPLTPAEGPEPSVVLIVQEGTNSGGAADVSDQTSAGLAKKRDSASRQVLEGLRKRVGAIREDVHQLVAELKQWRSDSRSNSR